MQQPTNEQTETTTTETTAPAAPPAAAPTPPATDARPARTPRAKRPQLVFTVVRTDKVSPHLVRVHVGGPAFDQLLAETPAERLATTDKYVKILFAKPELGLTAPYDLDALRAELAPEDMPVFRTYTVRAVDEAARTIAIDFVVHGDEGIAGPWAANAQPGQALPMSGPGGMYRPSESADARHLLLGDDSAIPAIAAALEVLGADARGRAIIEVGGVGDELALVHPAGVSVQWLHREGEGEGAGAPAVAGTLLAAAVEALDVPTADVAAGVVEVFAHGERGAMQAIRATLQEKWGLERRAMSLSAYWALGRAEDTFQAEKREPVGQIFAD